ncbi:MAG: hypothetical protein KDA32_08545 [Phycisphaerales bacterium]|nr:hypothetical protein [Phycisphaerales bacterium]
MKRHTLTLSKDGQHYVFRFVDGCESDALEAMIALARDENTDFDWFDAAILSYQIRDLNPRGQVAPQIR